jgi:primase-polymerase (primpol)-like protein
MWKYQTIPGKPKPKKPPFTTDGRAAAVDDPATWCNYAQAKAALAANRDFEGVGFMLDRGIVVIDLDNCLAEVDGVRRITKAARRVYELANSYTEISPSGKGLRIFLRGHLPLVNGQPQDGMKSASGEMYEARRYITVTGERVGQAREIRQDQEAIDRIYALLKPPSREAQRPQAAARSFTLTRSDEAVLSKARGARNGDKFTRLYEGNVAGYPSPSEAHLALAAMLVYWTNGDEGQVDRLFRASDMYKLYKEVQRKWDSRHSADGKTYGQKTIGFAKDTTRQL